MQPDCDLLPIKRTFVSQPNRLSENRITASESKQKQSLLFLLWDTSET